MQANASLADVPRLNWKYFFSEVSSNDVTDNRAMEVEKKTALQLAQLLQGIDLRLLGAHNVFVALSLAELNQCIGSFDTDTDSASTSRALVSLNNVLHLAPKPVSAALLQHGVTEALVRGLHSRIGKGAMTHELTNLIIMDIWVILINVEDLYGPTGADIMAQKAHVVELVISVIIYMANNPDHLFTQLGLATAARSVRIIWGLTRHATPVCQAARTLCSSIGLLARVAQLASWSPSDAQMPDPSGPPGCGPGGSLGELYISLLNVCSSFVASMLGLGGALDIRAEALKATRQWLLTEGQLLLLRAALESLISELHGHGRFLTHVRSTPTGGNSLPTEEPSVPAENNIGSSDEAGNSSRSSSADSSARSASILQQVDGAVRNLLTALGVPLMCYSGKGDAALEASALVEFSMRYHYALFQAGYVDVFRKLLDRSSSYTGDYLAFFVAISGIMLEGTTDIGGQFFKWGVDLNKANASDDLRGAADFSYLEGSGVSATEAEEFIRERVMPIVDSAARMRTVIELGQRAMLAGRMLPQVSQGASTAAFMDEPAPKATLDSSAMPVAGEKDITHCAVCRASKAVGGGTALQQCPCKAVAYCSKTCQLAHFPSHKEVCGVVLKRRKERNVAGVKGLQL